MMIKLVGLADKNVILSLIIRVVVFGGMKLISAYDELRGFLRDKCGVRDKYYNIKKFKDIHKGERCFIVCTGPSLTMDDLELLKKEITFGMNSLCLVEDKSDFRPTYYGIMDNIVYNKFKDNIERFCKDNMTVFASDRIARNNSIPSSWNILPVNVAYHTYDRWFKHNYWCKFSDNIYRLSYDMYSVTHLLIQVAAYMGFKDIYLVGADCTFQKNTRTHFVEYGTLDKDFDSAEDRCLAGYLPVKEYSDMHDVNVYNATRGGKLELFPRVELNSVVKENY